MPLPLIIYVSHSCPAIKGVEGVIARDINAPPAVSLLILHTEINSKPCYNVIGIRIARNPQIKLNLKFELLDPLLDYICMIKEDKRVYDIDPHAVILSSDINLTMPAQPHLSLPYHRLVVSTQATSLISFSEEEGAREQADLYSAGQEVQLYSGDDEEVRTCRCPVGVISASAVSRVGLREAMLKEIAKYAVGAGLSQKKEGDLEAVALDRKEQNVKDSPAGVEDRSVLEQGIPEKVGIRDDHIKDDHIKDGHSETIPLRYDMSGSWKERGVSPRFSAEGMISPEMPPSDEYVAEKKPPLSGGHQKQDAASLLVGSVIRAR
jgi:hypothetical protein